MSLRTKIMLALIFLLALVLGSNYFLIVTHARGAFLRRTRQQAAALVDLITAADTFALRARHRVGGMVGSLMIAQAALAAHLVDVAENHSELSLEDIRERLKDISERTVLDEFWITDEKGHAYLRNREDIDFTFPDRPADRIQAHEFRKLLSEERGQLQQRTMPRDLDGKPFKYAAVSGIDRPRIVQVGYEARSLETFREGATPRDLARLLTDRAGALSVMVVNGDGTVTDGPPWRTPPDRENSEAAKLLPYVRSAIQNAETVTRLDDDRLYVISPRPHDSQALRDARRHTGSPGPPDPQGSAFVVTFDASSINAVFVRGMAVLAATGAVVFVVGLLLALKVSRGISAPVERLAAEAAEIGKGSLDRRIEVKCGKELESLADSLNEMVVSLSSHVEQLENTTAAKERLESELRIAAQVQQAMLPLRIPERRGLRIAAFTLPARMVGGDFYDVIDLPDGKVGFCIGDVSGKGLPAAIFASQSLSVLRSLAVETGSVGRAMDVSNRLILDAAETTNHFVTLVSGICDPDRSTLTLANAGHMDPLLLRPGQAPTQLQFDHSIPLGVLPDFASIEYEAQLDVGDTLVLWTDGVTEARSPDDELFGQSGLDECLADCAELSPNEIIDRVRSSVEGFVGSDDLGDDMTLVALRFGERASVGT